MDHKSSCSLRFNASNSYGSVSFDMFLSGPSRYIDPRFAPLVHSRIVVKDNLPGGCNFTSSFCCKIAVSVWRTCQQAVLIQSQQSLTYCKRSKPYEFSRRSPIVLDCRPAVLQHGLARAIISHNAADYCLEIEYQPSQPFRALALGQRGSAWRYKMFFAFKVANRRKMAASR
jgi:hypothetical protein